MNNKNGFSLLLFLMYLMLFSMVTLFTIHLIASLLLPSISATRKCSSIIALHIATDLFVRDIRAMREKEEHNCKKISLHELVWHSGEKDIGWSFIENRLERMEGVYDQHWQSRKTSIVAVGVAKGTFIPEKLKNRIIGIEMTLVPEVCPQKQIVCYVAVS